MARTEKKWFIAPLDEIKENDNGLNIPNYKETEYESPKNIKEKDVGFRKSKTFTT